jgi:hypothetical protein
MGPGHTREAPAYPPSQALPGSLLHSVCVAPRAAAACAVAHKSAVLRLDKPKTFSWPRKAWEGIMADENFSDNLLRAAAAELHLLNRVTARCRAACWPPRLGLAQQHRQFGDVGGAGAVQTARYRKAGPVHQRTALNSGRSRSAGTVGLSPRQSGSAPGIIL